MIDEIEVPASLHALGVESALCVLIGGAEHGDPRFGLLGVGHRQRRAFTWPRCTRPRRT